MKNITKIISKYYIFIYFIIKNIFKNTNKDPNLKFMNISDNHQTDNHQTNNVDYNLTGGSLASSIQQFLSNVSGKNTSGLEKKDTNSLNNNDTELSEKIEPVSPLSIFDFKSKYLTKSQEGNDASVSDQITQEGNDASVSDKITQEGTVDGVSDQITQPDKPSNILSNNTDLLLEKQTSSNNMLDLTKHQNLSTINSFIVYMKSVNNPDKNTIDNLSEFFSKSDNLINELSNYDMLTYFIYIMNDKKYKESK